MSALKCASLASDSSQFFKVPWCPTGTVTAMRNGQSAISGQSFALSADAASASRYDAETVKRKKTFRGI